MKHNEIRTKESSFWLNEGIVLANAAPESSYSDHNLQLL